MWPDPIHPAVVHFPLVLAVLLPLGLAGFYLVTRRRGVEPRSAWLGVTSLAVLLALSAWVAVRTGSTEEERVEEVVPEQALESHEERAEALLLFAGAVMAVCAVGLARGQIGRVARGVATVAILALPPAALLVGHSGGELVYRHGAGAAYGGGAVAEYGEKGSRRVDGGRSGESGESDGDRDEGLRAGRGERERGER